MDDQIEELRSMSNQEVPSQYNPVLPDGWIYGPISDIAWINPSTNVNGLKDTDLVSFVPMASVGEDGRIHHMQARTWGEVRNGYTCFAENDVIFAKITPCMQNGKGALARGLLNGIGCGSTEYHILRAKNPHDVEFIYHLSQWPYLRKEATRYFTGSAGQQRVSRDFFTRYAIPLPSLPERIAIAPILSTIDEAIATTDAIIARNETVKQGLSQQLLTRGIDAEGRIRSEETHDFRDTPLGRLPVEWDVARLGNVCENALNGGTPSTKVSEYWEGTIPWITGADIIEQKVARIRRFITCDAVKNSATHIIPKGNLLLVTRTGLGKVAIAPFDIAISQDITGIIPKIGGSADYLYWVFRRYGGRLERLNQGTSINGIIRKDLMSFLIPLPAKEERDLITTILSNAESAFDLERAHRAHLVTLKQGLMQDLLSGRVRVPIAGGDASVA